MTLYDVWRQPTGWRWTTWQRDSRKEWSNPVPAPFPDRHQISFLDSRWRLGARSRAAPALNSMPHGQGRPQGIPCGPRAPGDSWRSPRGVRGGALDPGQENLLRIAKTDLLKKHMTPAGVNPSAGGLPPETGGLGQEMLNTSWKQPHRA